MTKDLFIIVLLALTGVGCSSSSSSSSTANSAPAPVTSGAWSEVVRFLPSSGTSQGFGVGPNSELVLAGGKESSYAPVSGYSGPPRTLVEFFTYTATSTAPTLTKTANLPTAVISPHVITVGGTMFVFGGYTPSSTFQIPNKEVWRYQDATNDFASEVNDPEPIPSSYYAVVGNNVYRVTPPYAFRGPTVLGGVGKFTPGTAWTNTALTTEIPVGAATAVVGNNMYLFGGRMFTTSTNNQNVFIVDLTTAQVTKTTVQPRERLEGIAIARPTEIHLFGGGSESTGSFVVTPSESYLLSAPSVMDRPDLEPFFYLARPQLSGDLVYVFDPRGYTFTVFRYKP
jgi:hypothetical protein